MSTTDLPPAPAEEQAALVALASLDNIGPSTLLDLHRSDGAPAAFEAICRRKFGDIRALTERVPLADRRSRLSRQARSLDPAALLEAQLARGHRLLIADRAGYPSGLLEDPNPPAILFVEGDTSLLDNRAVAIVGTRNTTRIGREIAADLGRDLARQGITVVSGLAIGIDAAAHGGALEALDGSVEPHGQLALTQPGRPIGVIASGLDIAYPRRHTALHRRIAATGLLVSELPVGHRPNRWRFPARNRLIAALSAGIVVVESRLTGGSMSTVDEAAKRGLEVMAVPGHPLAPASAGTNQLIFDGAALVRDVADILLTVGWDPVTPAPTAVRPTGEPADTDTPAGVAAAVLDRLEDGPASMAELVDRLEAPMAEVAAALLGLEANRFVVADNGWFELAARGAAALDPR